MNEKIGLVEETIRLVKKDDELVNTILKKREFSKDNLETIREMLRYNVWTVQQFQELSGLAVSTILNKMRPIYKKGELFTDLDFCYPFHSLKSKGPKCIVRNEKSERYIV